MNSSSPLTGLFLGAGASAELGMPLVWELTDDLKRWLTPETLRKFNEGWRLQGGGKSDTVIDDFLSVWERPEMHYEAVLGHLETQFRQSSPLRSEYQHLYSWLVEMVYHLLRIKHTELVKLIASHINILEGIAKLAKINKPLWIFSLNHDLIVECVAAHYSVEINSGFTSGQVSFPRRDDFGAKIGTVDAETLSAAQLESGMVFPSPGSTGINLLKIHGALDVFTFRNGVDMARLLPSEPTVESVIDMLRIANEELPCQESRSATPVRPTNEIAYTDDAGVMQFLRRTLLAGAYKFDKQQSQVLPKQILTQFQSNLQNVTTLFCIGYGFGDAHINAILAAWLEANSDRKLEIVSPRAQIPSFLTHLTDRVSVAREPASLYLDRITGIIRSRHEVLQKRLLSWVQKSRHSGEAKMMLDRFSQERHARNMEALQENLASLPMRDGDLDSEALGRDLSELAKEWADERQAEYDSALHAFLEENERRNYS